MDLAVLLLSLLAIAVVFCLFLAGLGSAVHDDTTYEDRG